MQFNTSLFCGPILLTFDQKYNTMDPADMPELDLASLRLEPLPTDGPILKQRPLGPIVAFAASAAKGKRVVLCDFGSAGAYGTLYRSWLPVPQSARGAVYPGVRSVYRMRFEMSRKLWTTGVVWSLFLLGSELAAAELWVGAACTDITPGEPVALDGQFELRISRKAATPITANVVALEGRQGDRSLDAAVMVSCDLVLISDTLLDKRAPGNAPASAGPRFEEADRQRHAHAYRACHPLRHLRHPEDGSHPGRCLLCLCGRAHRRGD